MQQTFKSELLSSTFPKKTKKHLLEKMKKHLLESLKRGI